MTWHLPFFVFLPNPSEQWPKLRSSSCYRRFTVSVLVATSFYPVYDIFLEQKITSEGKNYNNNHSVSNMCLWNVALVGSWYTKTLMSRMELQSRDHTHISPFNSSSVALASSPRTLLQQCSCGNWKTLKQLVSLTIQMTIQIWHNWNVDCWL